MTSMESTLNKYLELDLHTTVLISELRKGDIVFCKIIVDICKSNKLHGYTTVRLRGVPT